ncbi:maleylpyruvate isomerase N-terminal domain-containing protein [Promicromonospora sp. Marseille-Q5078]
MAVRRPVGRVPARGQSQAQIADRLGYSRNRIINDLDVLQERGRAERRNGSDRRRYLIHVTPSGRRTAAEVRDAIWAAEEFAAYLSEVTPGDLTAATPCAGWDVDDLSRHVREENARFGRAVTDTARTCRMPGGRASARSTISTRCEPAEGSP